MKKYIWTPMMILLLFLLSAPAAWAAEEPEAKRTSYGMEVHLEGAVTQDGQLICAVYDGDGRMLGIELVSDPDEILVYCDVNQARRVSVFSMSKENLIPAAAPAETAMEAPAEPIHVHVWDEGTVTQEATCQEAGSRLHTCKESDCNESPKATMTAALPATGHSWGDWAKADDSSHTRTCATNSAHMETEEHSWDEGTVTTAPTATTEGVKTYTCGECAAEKTEAIPVVTTPDVWFTRDTHNYYVNWTPVELESGEYYYVNGALVTAANCTLDRIIGSVTETTDLVVEAGTYSNRRTLYTVENAIVVENVDAPAVTITGQSTGKYLAEADMDDTDYAYYLTFKNPDGKTLYSNQKSASGQFDLSPYEGCTAEVYLMGGYTISADTTTLTMKRTGTALVESFTYCTAPTEVTEVSTYNDLLAALKKGGTVKMMEDITYTGTMMVNSGPEAVLDLNGHTLTLWNIQVTNAKVLTVLGTVEGSAVVNTHANYYAIHAEKDAILTVNGGSYGGQGGIRCNQNGTSARALTVSDVVITVDAEGYTKRAIEAYECDTVKLTNVTASTNSYAALQIGKCGTAEISGGSYTSTYDGTNSSCGAIVVNQTPVVSLTNVTAKSVQQALYVNGSDELAVTGGSYTSTMDNATIGYAVDVHYCDTVKISGITAEGLMGALWAYQCEAVTVSDSELLSTYEGNSESLTLYADTVTTLTLDGVVVTGKKVAARLRVGTTLAVSDSAFTGTGEMPRALEVIDWESVTLTHITVNNVNAHSQGAAELNGCGTVILQGSEKGPSVLNHCTGNDWQDGCALKTYDCDSVTISNTVLTGSDLYLYGSVTILSGTFEADPSAYVDPAVSTVTDNGDGTWTVTAL